jgi:hypothetical protein
LLKLSGEEHVLLLTMHHIVSDGWSMGVLVKEVAALYGAFSQGQESPLPELPVQYADFAVWQRAWLTGPVLEEQLAYWRARLAGVETLQLPADHARPPVQRFRGGSVLFQVDEATAAGLRAAARRGGATLFMTLLAGWQAVLACHCKQDEVVVGTSIAGRTVGETEGLIGFFVNQLVLRTDLSGDPTFGELVGRVREVCLGAYAHQEVPFERVVEELQPERSTSHQPLFQVSFVLQTIVVEDMTVGGLSMRPLRGRSSSAVRYDVELGMWDMAEGMGGGLTYNTDLFDESTIRRLVEQLQLILSRVAVNVKVRLGELARELAEAERRRQLDKQEDFKESRLKKLRSLRARPGGRVVPGG